MGIYQLRVRNKNNDINFVVPIDEETAMIDINYKKKTRLETIDKFIIQHAAVNGGPGFFSNRKEFLNYLKECKFYKKGSDIPVSFYIQDDMIPYIAYKKYKKELTLDIVYDLDENLVAIGEYLDRIYKEEDNTIDQIYQRLPNDYKETIRDRNIKKEDKVCAILRFDAPSEWRDFIMDLESLIINDPNFCYFLNNHISYISRYAYDIIFKIKNNYNGERKEEKAAYHDAIEDLEKYSFL